VTDVLIRDIPDEVLAGMDANAARLGISRVDYIRRRLAADAAADGASVSVKDLRRLSDRFADLRDECHVRRSATLTLPEHLCKFQRPKLSSVL
jgi:hypothetical protein